MLVYSLVGAGLGALIGGGIALKKWWSNNLWLPFAGYLIVSSASSGAAVGFLAGLATRIFQSKKINVKTHQM